MSSWPEPNWEPVEPFPFSAARGAFAGLTQDRNLLALDYYRRPEDGALLAVALFGPRAEGAPDRVHGGMILTALDEALGAACWMAGRPSLTVRLTTDFRLSVPLGARLLIETAVKSERHRLTCAAGTLRSQDGTVYAQAEGLFMRLDETAHRRIFGRGARGKTRKPQKGKMSSKS